MKGLDFRLSDELLSKWRELEALIANMHLKIDGLDLSIERIGEKLRLCYKEKPINDCKFTEKIEAVYFIPQLLKHYEERTSAINVDLGKALKSIDTSLAKARELRPCKTDDHS